MFAECVRSPMSDRHGVDSLLPEDVATALLLAPSLGAPDDEACTGLLTTYPPGEANVLSVTVSASPGDRLALWTRTVGERLPRRTAILDARPPDRSSGAASKPEGASLTVEELPEEAEPVDLAVAVARQVGAWASTPEPTLLCLHSLTALLDSFDRDRVVGVVNALDRLCIPGEVVAHHHMDPTAHEDSTVAAFRPLFDAVVEYLPDHGWAVTRADAEATSPSFRGSTAPPGGTAGRRAGTPETVPIPQSFDTVLDLLSVSRRRTLLYHLECRDGTTVPFEELVDAVFERERSIPKRSSPRSREVVRSSLDGVHLPKLEEAGIVEYDDRQVRYRSNPALASCLSYFEALELG